MTVGKTLIGDYLQASVASAGSVTNLHRRLPGFANPRLVAFLRAQLARPFLLYYLGADVLRLLLLLWDTPTRGWYREAFPAVTKFPWRIMSIDSALRF